MNNKCMKILAEMPLDQATDYEIVKETLLNAHQVTALSYLKEFRTTRRNPQETYTEYAFRLEAMQKAYIQGTHSENNAEKIRQLYLQEQFINTLPNDLAMYIADRKMDTLAELAGTLDKYCAIKETMVCSRNYIERKESEVKQINMNYTSYKGTNCQRNYR